jgi:transglutaminase-like putative cysteine protease
MDTLQLMQSLVNTWCIHPLFVQLSREICSRARANDRKSESKAIHAYVRRTVAYRQDPVGSEWVQDPLETAVHAHAGDCDDMSVLAGTLLQAIGHPCRMAAIRWRGAPTFSHAVCLDKTTGMVVDGVNPIVDGWPGGTRRVESMLEVN